MLELDAVRLPAGPCGPSTPGSPFTRSPAGPGEPGEPGSPFGPATPGSPWGPASHAQSADSTPQSVYNVDLSSGVQNLAAAATKMVCVNIAAQLQQCLLILPVSKTGRYSMICLPGEPAGPWAPAAAWRGQQHLLSRQSSPLLLINVTAGPHPHTMIPCRVAPACLACLLSTHLIHG